MNHWNDCIPCNYRVKTEATTLVIIYFIDLDYKIIESPYRYTHHIVICFSLHNQIQIFTANYQIIFFFRFYVYDVAQLLPLFGHKSLTPTSLPSFYCKDCSVKCKKIFKRERSQVCPHRVVCIISCSWSIRNKANLHHLRRCIWNPTL